MRARLSSSARRGKKWENIKPLLRRHSPHRRASQHSADSVTADFKRPLILTSAWKLCAGSFMAKLSMAEQSLEHFVPYIGSSQPLFTQCSKQLVIGIFTNMKDDFYTFEIRLNPSLNGDLAQCCSNITVSWHCTHVPASGNWCACMQVSLQDLVLLRPHQQEWWCWQPGVSLAGLVSATEMNNPLLSAH